MVSGFGSNEGSGRTRRSAEGSGRAPGRSGCKRAVNKRPAPPPSGLSLPCLPMSRRVIGTVILLASLSVLGVLLTQLLWLDTAFQVQRQRWRSSAGSTASSKKFNDRVVIALTNVTERILSINKDPSDLFDAVKQVRPNYFAVTINDTLHPVPAGIPAAARVRTQEHQRGLREYGIYDCFTDSIVYGSYVSLTDSVDPGRCRTVNC